MMICPSCHKRWGKTSIQCECGRKFVFTATQQWGISDIEFQQIIDLTEESNLKVPLYYTMHQLFMVWRKKRLESTYQAESKLLLTMGSFLWIYIFDNIYVTYGLTLISLISWFKWVQRPLIYLFKLRIIRFLSVIWGLCTVFWVYQHFKITYHVIPILILSLACLIDRIYSKSQSSYDEFLMQFQAWKKKIGFERLLEKPKLQTPKPEFQGEALYEYDMTDILLVEQDILVDFLVKNGFHKRHKILILSFQAYPRYSALQLRRLMSDKGAEKITVFLFQKEQTSQQAIKDTLQQLGIQRVGKKQPRVIYLGVSLFKEQQKINDWSSSPKPSYPLLSAFERLSPKQLISIFDQCIEQRAGISHPSIKPRALKDQAHQEPVKANVNQNHHDNGNKQASKA